MSIDVEGQDLNVIRSNNWEKFRPKIVLVECLDTDIEAIINSEIYKFMKAKNYGFLAKSVNTCFFKDLHSTF